MAALRAMGVQVGGHPLQGIDYIDAATRARASFRHSPGRGVRRTELHAALTARAAGLGIPIVTGKITQARQDEHGVEAAGLRARWLVGRRRPALAAARLARPRPARSPPPTATACAGTTTSPPGPTTSRSTGHRAERRT
ncbi:hypothetical protein [Nonomuraea dietziae]|uniref:hypothetical protein n=1 Tax=Nonomuraea dietziae TaxID=65515 RepID=UPI0031D65DF8